MSGAQIISLGAHERMTVKECLDYCARDHDGYQDVIVVGVDHEGNTILRSSRLTRAEASFILMDALDRARGK
ncbi:hypothetical protein [Brucella pseudogrignonensis]|uniref:Uncharacterized protein n=1 Tax=Brucella pseudogrignonensis TaxID=419475 RepID=A0A256GF65_9HYPH|nr:hypothetical protein [Brucella pseudogrignonensis]NKX16213.1 hypothetical protein [Brucella pseudogrignonensis]OYR25787.1 hypothetical protein CEV34_2673 [Brucella pseudogrignonensis]